MKIKITSLKEKKLMQILQNYYDLVVKTGEGQDEFSESLIESGYVVHERKVIDVFDAEELKNKLVKNNFNGK